MTSGKGGRAGASSPQQKQRAMPPRPCAPCASPAAKTSTTQTMHYTRLVDALDACELIARIPPDRVQVGAWCLGRMNKKRVLVVLKYLVVVTIPEGCVFFLYPPRNTKCAWRAVIPLECPGPDGKTNIIYRVAFLKSEWLDNGDISRLCAPPAERPGRPIVPSVSFLLVNVFLDVYVRVGGRILRVPADYTYSILGENEVSSEHEPRWYWLGVHVPAALSELVGKQGGWTFKFGVAEKHISRVAVCPSKESIVVLEELPKAGNLWVATEFEYKYPSASITQDPVFPDFVPPALDFKEKRPWPGKRLLEQTAAALDYTDADVRALYQHARRVAAQRKDRGGQLAVKWQALVELAHTAECYREQLLLLKMTRLVPFRAARAHMQGRVRARAERQQSELAARITEHEAAMRALRKSAQCAQATVCELRAQLAEQAEQAQLARQAQLAQQAQQAQLAQLAQEREEHARELQRQLAKERREHAREVAGKNALVAQHSAEIQRLQQEKPEHEDDSDASACAVCLERVVSAHAVVPCGHTYCGECLLKLPETALCPRCNGPISLRMRLWA